MARSTAKPSAALAAGTESDNSPAPAEASARAPQDEPRSPARGPAEPLFPPERTAAAVEAVLLTSERAISPGRIAVALGLNARGDGVKMVREAIEALNAAYDSAGRAFRIENVAGGWRIVTRPEFAPVVEALHTARESAKLSRAAVETLAIIAYKQPITRASVEAIRGVACGEVLRTLIDRRLIDIVGRAEELGRPMLYGTSRLFLETFGLASLRDLPSVGEIFPEVSAPAGKASPEAEPPGASVAELKPGSEVEP